jgi:hypothetical protein
MSTSTLPQQSTCPSWCTEPPGHHPEMAGDSLHHDGPEFVVQLSPVEHANDRSVTVSVSSWDDERPAVSVLTPPGVALDDLTGADCLGVIGALGQAGLSSYSHHDGQPWTLSGGSAQPITCMVFQDCSEHRAIVRVGDVAVRVFQLNDEPDGSPTDPWPLFSLQDTNGKTVGEVVPGEIPEHYAIALLRAGAMVRAAKAAR